MRGYYLKKGTSQVNKKISRTWIHGLDSKSLFINVKNYNMKIFNSKWKNWSEHACWITHVYSKYIYSCNEYMYKSMYESVNKNLLKKKNLEKP